MQLRIGKLKLLQTQYKDITKGFRVILCLYVKNLTQAWGLKINLFLKNTGQQKFILMKIIHRYRLKMEPGRHSEYNNCATGRITKEPWFDSQQKWLSSP